MITPEDIAAKYEQGPGTIPAPEVSDMQIPTQQGPQFKNKEEAEAFLDDVLPMMRKQNEYDKLIIEQLTNDGLLNRRPIEQIPGILGLEMKVREIQAQGFLMQYKQGMEDLHKSQQEMQQSLKEEADKANTSK